MKLASLFFILFGVMSVSALPKPGTDDLVAEVEPVEPMEPVEMKNETEVHKVELEHGKEEEVEVHHGRFRVKLKFNDDHTNSTTHKTRTRNRGGRS